MPAGFAGLEAQLWLWMVAMIRPGAASFEAPVFGASFVPVQLRLIIALAIGIPALAITDFTLPADGLASIARLMLVLAEGSEEHTSELQSLMRTSYAVFCLYNTKDGHYPYHP